MVDSGALFTRNLYRKYLAPSRSDSHYLWVGRISGVSITLISVLYAVFLIQRVLYSFLLTETMATFVGISILGGILWRRATRWGAVASIAVAIGTDLGLYALRHQRLDFWDPGVFLGALLTGTAVFIVVSLLTSREPRKRLDSFFGRLQTPSDGASTDVVTGPPSPEEARAHAEAGRQLILLNVFHLRKGAAGAGILRAYSTDLRGFGLGCLIVAALVALLWFLLRL
jgi:Na+/proline symporter